METRKCKQCGLNKGIIEFIIGRYKCKICSKEYHKKYRQENQGKLNEYNKKYRQENQEKIYESRKKYRQENKEIVKERYKKYHQENHEKIKEYNKKCSKENSALLNPTYLKKQLKAKGFCKEDIESNPMLIELQKAITINKRLTKNNQNE